MLTARDVIAGVLADALPGLTATWIAEDGSRRADIAETRLNLTDVAADLIAAGVTMPGVTEREKARACWCEKVLKRGLFGTEWKCCLRAGHDGECR